MFSTTFRWAIALVLSFFSTKINAQCAQLVWSDEFNGTSLDLTKWTPIVGEGGAVSGNAELQYYTDRSQNIQVSSGTLKIIALLESYGGNSYTSARMQTKNLGDWLYGRFEARIKLPVAQGMWPAFWLLPTDNTYGIWPRSGEIDIMELIGREPSHAYATIHTSADATVHSFGNRYDLSNGTFADAFHVFSMEWSPNLLKFYVDGVLYSTQTNTTVSPYPWVFDKRFYMLLNLAIGGPWPGAPDATTTFPQTMEVDYVRVYQKIGDLAMTGKTLVEPNTPSVSYAVPTISGITYQWAVSGAGNTIASGQGTAQATVNWATTSGTVSVLMNDGCTPSATVATPVTVSPNLWDNYGFEQNYVSWETRPPYDATKALFSTSTSDFTEGSKSACVQTNTVGTNPWDIQLSRTNLNLTAGTSYTLRFKAKANAARTIPATFIRTSDFSYIASVNTNLTTAWQQFSLTFTPVSNENVMLNLDLAAQLGTNCFDDFTFARTSVLPIELLDFQGFVSKENNRLTWQFADAKDVKDIVLEKSSDGILFNAFVSIDKNGAKETLDNTPFALTYYRLKMIELDGKVSFSKIISLKRGDILRGPKIYPNPVHSVLTIENIEGQSVEIVNTLGQVLQTLPKSVDYSVKLDISALPNGVYFVKTTGRVVRFVKN